MSTAVVLGQTSVSAYFLGINLGTNVRRTDLVYNTTGLTLSYTRERAAAVSAVAGGGTAPVSLANAASAWAAWGFVHVAGGLYRIDFPDAAFAAAGAPKFAVVDAYDAAGVFGLVFIGWFDLTGQDMRSSTPALTDVRLWNGSAVGASDTAGYPKVTIKNGAGAGELLLSAGLLSLVAAYDAAKTAAPTAAAIRAEFDANSTQIAAALTAIGNLNNLSALANLYGSPVLEIPDAGTALMPFNLVVRDGEGHLVDVDANAVTLTVANAAGVDRSANLSAVTRVSQGVYTFNYGVASNAAKEGLRLAATATVGGSARRADIGLSIEDLDSVTAIGQILALAGRLPVDPASDTNATANKAAVLAAITALAAIASAVKARTDALPNDPADASELAAAFAVMENALGTLATATAVSGMPAALIAASQTTPIAADLKKVNGVVLVGTGVDDDQWGPPE
jgi:hypothetical protein